ncbi:MAG: exopolysaccharide Pel transporter PelG [Planctomycetota bacterium]|nr:exopolysaccharide Pel transporter PelG [Planctomycetota bacterium]
MAGIGFELKRLITEEGGLISRVRGYAIASLVSAGPWIVTIVGLVCISLTAPVFLDQDTYEAFRAIVTYAFAFSLIVVGAVQMSFTRRAADLLYSKHYKRLLPALAHGSKIIAIVQGFIGTFFCALAGLPVALSIASVTLYIVISLTWLALIWLGATKEHKSVLRSYLYGGLVSFAGVSLAAAGAWGIDQSAASLVGAYALGQGLTLVLLLRAAVKALDMGGVEDGSIMRSVRTYPRLALVGLLYNTAIWADQIVFWCVDGVGTHVRFHPLYDTCKFLAYASVIPSLALMLVRVETSFYECYRAFYGSILRGFPLETIERRKRAMLEDLRESTVRLLRIQGAVTLVMLLLAPTIIRLLGLGDAAVDVLRACSLAAFFHVMLLIVILVQMYFDLRSSALWTSLVFLVANTVLALWSVGAGVNTYGIGYAAAAFLALCFAYATLVRNYDRLEFLSFTQRPVEIDPLPESAR